MIPIVDVRLDIWAPSVDHEYISRILEVEPTQVWKKRDSVSGTKILRKSDGWRYGLGARETYDAEALLSELMSTLGKKVERLNSEEHLGRQVGVIVDMDDQTPALGCTAEVIAWLASFRATLDIDIQLVGSSEESVNHP